MEEKHNNPSLKEIMEMYPTGTYFWCAASMYDHPEDTRLRPHKIYNCKDIIGVHSPNKIYADPGNGCLFYHGIWAKKVDADGNPLETSNYQIF
jgi:hypothetical protein